MGRITLPSVYVGLTRVRKARDLAIWPCAMAQLTHLLQLKRLDEYRDWSLGYDEDGRWTFRTSANANAQHQLAQVSDINQLSVEDLRRFMRLFCLPFVSLSKDELARTLQPLWESSRTFAILEETAESSKTEE